MFDFSGLNWLAVLASTIAAMVIGFLWYGPVFGKLWLRAMGKTSEEIRAQGAGNPAMYAITAVAWFIIALVLALIVNAAGETTLAGGVLAGLQRRCVDGDGPHPRCMALKTAHCSFPLSAAERGLGGEVHRLL